jgi:hypothetical protein
LGHLLCAVKAVELAGPTRGTRTDATFAFNQRIANVASQGTNGLIGTMRRSARAMGL